MSEKHGVKVGLAEIAPVIKESLNSGNDVRLIVTGTSMYPLLTPERDAVVVSPCKSIKKRDIAFFERKSGLLVMHRVVKVKKDGFYCVGDNQTVVEGPISYENLLGKITLMVRNGKEIDVKSTKYRAYAWFWTAVRPIRRGVLAAWRKLKRVFKGK
jgi:hypothetical protein